MTKPKLILSIFGICTILLILYFILTNGNIGVFNINQSNTNNSTIQLNVSNSNISQSNNTNYLDIPTNDYIINHINWSNYPNLKTGYVLAAYKAGPNDVLNYEFIDVQICTEIKDTDSEIIINEQLTGVAHEARLLYGPASGINIHGTKNGAEYYCVSILPYNDTV
jgi:hypothetical protein